MTATATVPQPRSRKTRSGGIVLNADRLRRLIRDLEPAVPARSGKSVLQHILLGDGRAVSTDLEIRIEVPVPEATEPMLLPFARLKAIAGTLHQGDEVRLSISGSSCVVEAAGGRWRLPVEDAAEFPAASADDGASIGRLPAEQLASLLTAVRFACDTESSRYALGAVCIDYDRGDADAEEGIITFVATDGRRLSAASARLAAQDLDNSQTLVPLRAVNALVKLAAHADAVQMTATGSEFVAVIGEYAEGDGVTGITLRARLTEGRFPRWRDVDIEHDTAASSAVVGELLHAVDMASICTSETSKGVTIAIDDAGLKISARAAEAGESRVECPLLEAGQPVTVQIDPRFASQWLSCGAFDQAETVAIECKDATSAIVMRCGDCRNVIMPMSAD